MPIIGKIMHLYILFIQHKWTNNNLSKYAFFVVVFPAYETNLTLCVPAPQQHKWHTQWKEMPFWLMTFYKPVSIPSKINDNLDDDVVDEDVKNGEKRHNNRYQHT